MSEQHSLPQQMDERIRINEVLKVNPKVFPLPKVIEDFYDACSLYDNSGLTDCFLEDAILYDEDQEYHGQEVISSHILTANKDASVTMEITDYNQKDNEEIVTTMLTGSFAGSPIPLDFHFGLQNQKIKSLQIVLAGE